MPVLVEADGSKLAKSARSVRLEDRVALPQLLQVFALLGLAPPPGLDDGDDRRSMDLGDRSVGYKSRRQAPDTAFGALTGPGSKPACLNAALRYPLICSIQRLVIGSQARTGIFR